MSLHNPPNNFPIPFHPFRSIDSNNNITYYDPFLYSSNKTHFIHSNHHFIPWAYRTDDPQQMDFNMITRDISWCRYLVILVKLVSTYPPRCNYKHCHHFLGGSLQMIATCTCLLVTYHRRRSCVWICDYELFTFRAPPFHQPLPLRLNLLLNRYHSCVYSPFILFLVVNVPNKMFNYPRRPHHVISSEQVSPEVPPVFII